MKKIKVTVVEDNTCLDLELSDNPLAAPEDTAEMENVLGLGPQSTSRQRKAKKSEFREVPLDVTDICADFLCTGIHSFPKPSK
jgi:hypothetical protein